MTQTRNPWLRMGYVRTAEHTFVPQDNSGTGMMVCFAPPKEVTDHLVMDDPDAEPEHDLHVTLAYLGKTGEHSKRQLNKLPYLMDEWAKQHGPVRLSVEGSGTFLAPEEGEPHVLHALVNAPGLHRMQAHLVDYLKEHGYSPREDHGYIPHITLGYVKHNVRFLPRVERKEWTARHVWTAIGEHRSDHRLGG